MYKCVCGKEFEKIQAYNGHKSHCLVNAEKSGKGIEKLLKEEKQRAVSKKTSEKLKESQMKKTAAAKQRKEEKLKQFILEEHHCEHCGRLMTEKYGCGKFCCRSCANSHKHSIESRQRLSVKMKERIKEGRSYPPKSNRSSTHVKHILYVQKYEQNPSRCTICGKILDYEHRNRKTCGDKNCYHLYCSRKQKEAVKKAGGNLNKNGTRGNCKYGTYKGYHCDSS